MAWLASHEKREGGGGGGKGPPEHTTLAAREECPQRTKKEREKKLIGAIHRDWAKRRKEGERDTTLLSNCTRRDTRKRKEKGASEVLHQFSLTSKTHIQKEEKEKVNPPHSSDSMESPEQGGKKKKEASMVRLILHSFAESEFMEKKREKKEDRGV